MFGKITRRNFNIIVPFICYRCGHCCYDYTPQLSDDQLRALALQRNQPFEDVKKLHKKAYFTGDTGETCPALDEAGSCLIYDIRPDCCREYPLNTFNGANGVLCPGYEEHWRAYDTILQYVENHRHEEGSIDEKTLLKLLMQAKPSCRMIEEFVKANRISKQIVKSLTPSSMRKND